jgi:hypothetical protein
MMSESPTLERIRELRSEMLSLFYTFKGVLGKNGVLIQLK